jgi:hypothetical protein
MTKRWGYHSTTSAQQTWRKSELQNDGDISPWCRWLALSSEVGPKHHSTTSVHKFLLLQLQLNELWKIRTDGCPVVGRRETRVWLKPPILCHFNIIFRECHVKSENEMGGVNHILDSRLPITGQPSLRNFLLRRSEERGKCHTKNTTKHTLDPGKILLQFVW